MPAGQAFYILAQDVGCELYINAKRAKTLNENERLTVDAIGGLIQDPCSCGWARCGSAHRIYGWNPYARIGKYVDLRSFVASAIKGPSLR